MNRYPEDGDVITGGDDRDMSGGTGRWPIGDGWRSEAGGDPCYTVITVRKPDACSLLCIV